MKLIPYLRASTKDKQTPEHQLPEIERWAAAHSHELLSAAIERESGRNDDRPIWNEVLARVLRGEADGVVAVDMSRFARSAVHLIQVSELLRKAGRHMACVRQPLDTTTPVGRYVFGNFALLGQLIVELGQDAVAKGIAFSRDKRKAADGTPGAWGRRRELLPGPVLLKARALRAAGLSWRRVSARLFAAGYAQPARSTGKRKHPPRAWPIGTLRDALDGVGIPDPAEAPNPAGGAG